MNQIKRIILQEISDYEEQTEYDTYTTISKFNIGNPPCEFKVIRDPDGDVTLEVDGSNICYFSKETWREDMDVLSQQFYELSRDPKEEV